MDEYKTFAGVYDFLLFPVLHQIRLKTAKVVSQLNPEQIIDLCCGTGNQLKYLKRKGFENIEGVDISHSMLRQTRKGGAQINCKHGDATKLNFPDNSFDTALISFALHEKPLETAISIVKEAVRITRHGGHLLVVDYAFDSSVSPFVKTMVRIVERFAGKDHYRYFKNYIKHGGLESLFRNMEIMQEHRFHSGATRLRIYKIKNQ